MAQIIHAPISPHSEFASFHLSKRLLIEQIEGSDCSVVFSPVSGSLDVANSDDVDRLRALAAGEVHGLDNGWLAYLEERGYLFSSEEEESKLLTSMIENARQSFALLAPNTYVICPTLACNLSCAYCFEGDSLLDKAQGVMSDAQISAVFNAIDILESDRQSRHADLSTELYSSYVSLFGGEPFLPSTRQCVERVLAMSSEREMLISATTNGVNITRFGDLFRRYASGIDGVQITLDGPPVMHNARRHRLGGQGTFDEIARGIDFLLDVGIRVNLRMNTDKQNLPTLPELCEYILSRGWTSERGIRLSVAPVTIHGPNGQPAASGCSGASYEHAFDELSLHRELLRMAAEHAVIKEVCTFSHFRHLDHVSALIDQFSSEPNLRRQSEGKIPLPRYWYCEQGTGSSFAFTPDGNIYTCTEAVGKAQHAIGRFDPALEFWKEQSSQWLGRTIASSPKCFNCSISTLCGGGCHIAARDQAKYTSPSASRLDHVSSDLVQIGAVGTFSRKQRDNPAMMMEVTEPYCAGAEQIVRDFLRTEGRKLLAA